MSITNKVGGIIMAITGVTSKNSSYYTQNKSVEEANKQTNRTTEDYTKQLNDKFNYINKPTTIEGIPTTVSVSPAFIKKCANDPEKAKFLEENLKVIPDCVRSLKNYTKTMAGSPVVTYTAYQIDENGNISMMSGCTNDPDGKIARENSQKKAKENKEKAEKLEEKRAEKRAAKRAEEEKAEEKRRQNAVLESRGEIAAPQKSFSFTVTGSNVEEIAEKISSVASSAAPP